jgi:hypothetical protein
MKNANDIIADRTHDLPACSACLNQLERPQTYSLYRAATGIGLRTVSCASVQFRVQRRVFDLESRYITLSVKGNLKQSSQLPLQNSGVLSVPVEKCWILSGQQAVLLMNEDSTHIQHETKSIQILRSANIRM